MAVYLLASNPIVGASDQYIRKFQRYCPRRGMLLEIGAVCVVSLDGQCSVGLCQMYVDGWWPQQQKLLIWDINEEVEIRAFTRQPPAVSIAGMPNYAANGTYIRLADRRLWRSWYNTMTAVYPDGSTKREGPEFRFTFQGGPWMLHEGRNPKEVFLSGNIDDVLAGVFYDTETQTISSPYYFIPKSSGILAYAPEHGVLVSGHLNPFEICVWALEVQPTTVSPVEVFSGVVKNGQIVTFQVRVTGDHDDPVEDELVNWENLGTGRLLDTQSKTDANGYAQARVLFHVRNTGEMGTDQVTLMASVVC